MSRSFQYPACSQWKMLNGRYPDAMLLWSYARARAVSPSAGFRFVCYCKDCQAFARFLKRPDILDAGGGTDIFQLPPSQVTFIAGLDALRCVRLSQQSLALVR